MSENERIYTVPLREAFRAQRYRRAERAITAIKDFTKQHMKAVKVVIDTSVNESVWARGIRSPPRRIRVKMTKDTEGTVTVTLAEAEEDAKE